jgi:hypothetical protein
VHLPIPGSGGWFGSRMAGYQNRLLTPGKQRKLARDTITRFWPQTSFKKYTKLRDYYFLNFGEYFLQNSRSSLLLVSSVVTNTLLRDWWVTHKNINCHQWNQRRLRQEPSSSFFWVLLASSSWNFEFTRCSQKILKGWTSHTRSTREGYPWKALG